MGQGQYAVANDSLLAQSVLTGKYTILREIGRGGMATVYLADDLRHRRQVAVKVLHPSLADVATDRFNREIGIVAQLQHPHIVPLYDSGEWNGHLFYVMPFVEGETLAHRLERAGPLPVKEALRTARDVAAALEYAHARGVIHRDIKPSNVLITADVAVVADFGIARALGESQSTALTRTGVVGTPMYMSPEHAEGTAAVGSSSDIYALGCVLHEMLTGKPPYVASTFGEMIVKHVAAPVPSVRALRDELSENLDLIVQTALAKRVEDRWASAAALREALEHEIADTPTEHRDRVATLRRIREASAIRTRRLRYGALALALAALGVASAVWRPWSVVRGRAGVRLSANLVAIAPFDALGSNLELWRDGMVDVLSRNFDGAGPLRSVPPTTIIRAWSGRADAPSAQALARRTGAGLVVLGSVIQSGSDSVKVTAQLYDAVRDSVVLSDLVFGDEEERVDRLCDSVTVALLRHLNYDRPIAAVSGTTIGAHSFAALKAFLQGEQLYRRNDTAGARLSYERAITLDSGFTLAYRRMRGVTRFDEFDSVSLTWALRAGAMNRGLSRRDSLLVLADSLVHATRPLQPGGFTAVSWDNLTRRVAVLNEAARLYPDDPEVWNDLGEMRVHSGSRMAGNNRELTMQAFEKALALDSVFTSAYFHAIELAAEQRGAAVARKYALANLALDPRASDRRLVARLLQGRVSDRELRSLANTMEPVAFRNAGYLLRLWNDSSETAARVLRHLLAREDSLGENTRVTRNLLRLALLRRGHLRAANTLSRNIGDSGPDFFRQLALVGVIPADSANKEIADWARHGAMGNVLSSMFWLSARGDTIRLREIRARCDSARAASRDSSNVPLPVRACGPMARAHLALAGRDTATAARLFGELPDSLCTGPCTLHRITSARLFLALGGVGRATMVLDRRQPGISNGDLEEGWWHVERARAAERSGDHARAVREYRVVLRLWATADAELQPYVTEARRSIQGGPRR